MIAWLESIIGVFPADYQFIEYITASVLVVVLVVNIINCLFSPFRIFK